MLLVIPLGDFQAFGNEIDIPLGGSDAGRRLLLERVEDVYRLLESNRVDGSIRVSVVRFDDLIIPILGYSSKRVPTGRWSDRTSEKVAKSVLLAFSDIQPGAIEYDHTLGHTLVMSTAERITVTLSAE